MTGWYCKQEFEFANCKSQWSAHHNDEHVTDAHSTLFKPMSCLVNNLHTISIGLKPCRGSHTGCGWMCSLSFGKKHTPYDVICSFKVRTKMPKSFHVICSFKVPKMLKSCHVICSFKVLKCMRDSLLCGRLCFFGILIVNPQHPKCRLQVFNIFDNFLIIL
jgi:hypothetical protein